MAAVKTAPTFITRLKSALVKTLKANGIAAKVETQPVPTTKFYRVAVIAPQFKEMKHTERQSVVWRIAEAALSPEDRMRISMILTLTPREAHPH